MNFVSVIARGLVSGIVLFALASCTKYDTNKWEEEVRLHDGTRIVLEGSGKIVASGFPMQHRGSVVYQSYFHRASNAYWNAGHLAPRIFELIDGVPHVLLTVDNGLRCSLVGFPDNGLLIFRWSDSAGWTRLDSKSYPRDWHFNIFPKVFDGRDHSGDLNGKVSLEKKQGQLDYLGTLDAWVEKYGHECEKARGTRYITDETVPKLEGFHSKPEP